MKTIITAIIGAFVICANAFISFCDAISLGGKCDRPDLDNDDL